MKEFFNIENIESRTDGFGLFSAAHLVWIGIAVVSVLLIGLLYKKSSNRSLVRKIVAISLLIFEVSRDILLMASGQHGIGTLPFHLCGMSVYIILIHSFQYDQNIWQFMYSFSFSGALFAIVFPDWTNYPLFNILTFYPFIIHILIICYILMQLAELKPDIRYAGINLLVMLSLTMPVFIFNKITGTNYMFLNWPVAPLTLFSFLGSPGYILGYLPLIIISWSLMYLPFIIKKRI